MNIRLRIAAATLAASLLAIAAASAEVVYYRGNSADPETLDVHKTSTVYEGNILRDLYEGLVVYDAKAKVVPGVAESWTLSPDGLVYTFKLRANAKWSNGDPVSAHDFVFSLQRIQTPATGAKYANVLYPIKNAEKVHKNEAKPADLGVKALDDRTLEITLEARTPYFLELLTHQTGLPVHKASVEKLGADFVKPGNKVSNGAYTLAAFTPNDHIRLVKNANFHDAANVKIDTVVYYPTDDRSAALKRFEAGELDSNDDVPTEQIKYIREKFGKKFHTGPYLGSYYYTIKTDKAPFSDVNVRRAVSLAIDRDFLSEAIWGRTMIPAYSFVPPGISNYAEPAYADYKDKSQIDREDEAKRLLTGAGFGAAKPLKLELRYNTSENHKNTAVAIANMLKPVGVEVSLVNTDTKTHYAHLREKRDYDVARAGWIADYNDPQNFLFLLESDNPGLNYANYKNAEFDALMDKAAVTGDLAERGRLLQQAEAIMMRDLPYIPLLYYAFKNLVSDRIKGWEDNIVDVHATRWLSKQ